MGWAMPLLPVDWLYRRLGTHYPVAFFVLQLSVGLLVTAGTLGLVFLYYDAPARDALHLLAIVEALTLAGLSIGFARAVPRLRPIKAWIKGERSREATLAAWDAAVNLPIRTLRRDAFLPAVLVFPAASVITVDVLSLSWVNLIPLLAAAAVAAAYAAVLQYFAIELGLQPVVDEVAERLPPDFDFEAQGLSLRTKLIAGLPLFSVITGLIVGAFTSRAGSGSLGVSVGVTLVVAFTVALELALLLANSITRPLAAIEEGMAAVRAGRYDAQVKVTTNDELGGLADGFNRMAAGLAEREQLREAFGTYLDRDVAEYILSEGVSPQGVEVDVSILFCDVRNFTGFAERSEATEVVACLNALFEGVVPVISRHGGHIDKFIGDGLLAVFGAPEPHRDHADRAVAAAVEILEVTEAGVAGELRVGVGVNSGPVVAGAIGGAGRLNFSVIGDAVNVAARVESATRRTGDGVLLTGATRERLTRTVPLVPRGTAELKGRDEPIDLFTPGRGARAEPSAAAALRSA
ncbi:MAG: adenylate cyclase [Solirubrobacteraceae bacterium]|nr:adenylate cyclase [Solirubrobacteraceae bacterium]